MASALILAFAGAAGAQVQVTKNTTKHKLDEPLIAEIHNQVVRQMERSEHKLTQRTKVELQIVSSREAELALVECAQGGCGHLLRFGVTPEQSARVVFLSVSRENARLWMDEPDAYLLAKAITVLLDYENRLYLAPDEIHAIADAAALAAWAERRGKVSVDALRASQ